MDFFNKTTILTMIHEEDDNLYKINFYVYTYVLNIFNMSTHNGSVVLRISIG